MIFDQSYAKAINDALQGLSSTIGPDEEEWKERKIPAHKVSYGTIQNMRCSFCNKNSICFQIKQILQVRSRYKIDRMCVAGSAGKKTEIFSSDIDCVLFINDVRPPYNDLLKEFNFILKAAKLRNVKITAIKTTRYSLQFKAGEFEYDFLPAPNFVRARDGKRHDGRKMQYRKTLEYMARDPEKYKYVYGAALAEATVDFMKTRSGFANEMVRLAKYWLHRVEFEEYISGKSAFIETIAVYATKSCRMRDSGQKEAKRQMPYLYCFKRFLELLRNFDNINVVFGHKRKLTYKGHALCELEPLE